MKDLRKVVPPQREILRGIWLSFYYGAKIGVLGANGAGKSSLLRIMAGVDHDYQGEAWIADGMKVGYLPQEPQLDPKLDVKGNVELAVASQRGLLQRFEEISMAFAEPMDDKAMEKLLAEQSRVQEQIDAHNLWTLDTKIEIAMDALRLPPWDADVSKLSGGEKRRVALCRVLLEQPDMLLLDEPTNHLDAESVAWLERHLAEFPGTVVAITHDRYFLDNVAKWILELIVARAFRGRATTRAGWSRSRTGCRPRRSRPAPGSGRCSASSSGCGWRRGRGRPRTRRAFRSTRSWRARRRRNG
jgi:ATPase subunit of ABC transporter with duplicated ATPase domains